MIIFDYFWLLLIIFWLLLIIFDYCWLFFGPIKEIPSLGYFKIVFQQFYHFLAFSEPLSGNNCRTSFWSKPWIFVVRNGRSRCKDHSIFWESRSSLISFLLPPSSPSCTFSFQNQVRLWSNWKCWKPRSQSAGSRWWFSWRSREIWKNWKNF